MRYAQETLLFLEGVSMPKFSARFLEVEWSPIDQAADLRRDINGVLVNLSPPGFQKFQVTISTEGILEYPAFSGWMPGLPLVVHCPFEFAFIGPDGQPITNSTTRGVVDGSVRATPDGTVFCRPILRCMIAPRFPNGSLREWEARRGWKLELWEI